MVIAKVHRGKNGRAMVDYPLKEQDYSSDSNPRVRVAMGINVRSAKTAKQEMADVWKYYGKDNGDYIQAQHIIQSFSNDEADPNSETDVQHAHLAGCELVHRLYPEQQAIVVTHADNTDGGTKNAMVHNHIIVNQVNPNTGRSLRDTLSGHHATIAKVNDEIAKDFGFREAINQNPVWENVKASKKRKRNKSAEVIEGVKAVLDKKQVTTMDEYVGALDEFGISVKHKGKKGRDLKRITYNKDEAMTQNPRDSRGFRDTRLTKLNGDVDLFSRDALMKMFEENEKELEQEQQEKLERDKQNAERIKAEQEEKEMLDAMLAEVEKLNANSGNAVNNTKMKRSVENGSRRKTYESVRLNTVESNVESRERNKTRRRNEQQIEPIRTTRIDRIKRSDSSKHTKLEPKHGSQSKPVTRDVNERVGQRKQQRNIRRSSSKDNGIEL